MGAMRVSAADTISFDLLRYIQNSNVGSRVNEWGKEYLYLLMIDCIKARDVQNVFNLLRDALSGKKTLLIERLLRTGKGVSSCTAAEIAGLSNDEIDLYYAVYNMFLFIDEKKYAGTIDFNASREERAKQVMTIVLRQLGTFAKEMKIDLKKITLGHVLADAVNEAAGVACGNGIIRSKSDPNINVYYEPMIKLAARGVEEHLNLADAPKARQNTYLEARAEVVKNLRGVVKANYLVLPGLSGHMSGYYVPQMPRTEKDRMVLMIYAELFTRAGYGEGQKKWQDMKDEELYQFVSGCITKFASGSFSFVSQRYLVYKCALASFDETQVYAGRLKIVHDYYGLATPGDVGNRVEDILDGNTSVNVYLTVNESGQKVLNSGISYTINGVNYAITKGMENDEMGRLLAYAMSNIYGYSREQQIDQSAFIFSLYAFCQSSGYKGSVTQLEEGRGWTHVIKVDKALLKAILRKYIETAKGSQVRFATSGGKIRTFDDLRRIADSSPLVAVKCILVSRGWPSSDARKEMLTVRDLLSVADVFEEMYDKRGKLLRAGISKDDADRLRKFAERLRTGAYSGMPYVMKVAGPTGYTYCIISYIGIGDPKTEDEKLYNQAVMILNRIATQLFQISPAEDVAAANAFGTPKGRERQERGLWGSIKGIGGRAVGLLGNVVGTAQRQEKARMKLDGVDLQVLLALKGYFYPDRVRKLRAALEAVGWKVEKLKPEQMEELEYMCGYGIDNDFWKKLRTQFPAFFATLTGVSKDLQLDIKFPYRFSDGTVANNETEFIDKIFSSFDKLDSISVSPGEMRMVTLAKQMTAYIITKLGAYSIEHKNALGDILGSMPGNAMLSNVVLKGGAFIADMTFDTSVRNGTDITGLGHYLGYYAGADRQAVQKYINYLNVGWRKMAESATNPEGLRNSFVPFVYMFLTQVDNKASIRIFMDLLMPQKGSTAMARLSTLDTGTEEKPGTLDRVITQMEEFQNKFNTILKGNPGLRAMIMTDPGMKEMMDHRVFKFNDNGEIEFQIETVIKGEFRRIVAKRVEDGGYGGRFTELFYEKNKIPNDRGIQRSAAYFTDAVMAMYGLYGMAQAQSGTVSIETPISADDIMKGWRIANAATPENESFERFAHQAEVNPTIRNADIPLKERVLDAPAEIVGTAMGTKFDFLSCRLYFSRIYVTMAQKALRGAMYGASTGDWRDFIAASKELAVLSVQMVGYGFNPMVMWNKERVMDLYMRGNYEELIGYISVVLGYGLQVIKRDIVLVRNLLRTARGLPQLTNREVASSLRRIDLEIEERERKLEKAEEKFGKNKISAKKMEATRAKIRAEIEQLEASKGGRAMGFSILEKPMQAGYWAGEKVIGFFRRAFRAKQVTVEDIKEGRVTEGKLGQRLGKVDEFMSKPILPKSFGLRRGRFSVDFMKPLRLAGSIWNQVAMWEWAESGLTSIGNGMDWVSGKIQTGVGKAINRIRGIKPEPAEGAAGSKIIDPNSPEGRKIMSEAKIPGRAGVRLPGEPAAGERPVESEIGGRRAEGRTSPIEEAAVRPTGNSVWERYRAAARQSLKGANWVVIIMEGGILTIDVYGNRHLWPDKKEFLKTVGADFIKDNASLALFTAGDYGLQAVAKGVAWSTLENAAARMPLVGGVIGMGMGVYDNYEQMRDTEHAQREAALMNVLDTAANWGAGGFGYALGASAVALTGGGAVLVFIGGTAIAVGASALYRGGRSLIIEGTKTDESNNAHELEKLLPIMKVRSEVISDDFRRDLHRTTDMNFVMSLLAKPEVRQLLTDRFDGIELDSPYLLSQDLLDHLIRIADSSPALKGRKVKVKISLTGETVLEGEEAHPRYNIMFYVMEPGTGNMRVLRQEQSIDHSKNITSMEKPVMTIEGERSMWQRRDEELRPLEEAYRAGGVMDYQSYYAGGTGGTSYQTPTAIYERERSRVVGKYPSGPDMVAHSFTLERMAITSDSFRNGMVDISQHVMDAMRKLIAAGFVKLGDDAFGKEFAIALAGTPNQFEKFIKKNPDRVQAVFVAGVRQLKEAYMIKDAPGAVTFGPKELELLTRLAAEAGNNTPRPR